MCLQCSLIALLLVAVANGAPVMAGYLLKRRFACPVDAGVHAADGRPLFGRSKTWRGLLAALGCSAVFASALNVSAALGMVFAAWAMAGDLLASFCKRRLGKTESSQARGFDTVPESLLPAWLLSDELSLGAWDVAAVVVAFFLMEEFLSPLLYKWHIRRRPY
ncbi:MULTISPECIES: CDP-archaeol synthase [Methylomonas]|uniref:CDP-archaeol synthase n=1 Tax=Methylomonas TaxID=416 RepID=UPI001231C854|nr:CDP-archaeol synthase [Methylomonas rhizoryzae]